MWKYPLMSGKRENQEILKEAAESLRKGDSVKAAVHLFEGCRLISPKTTVEQRIWLITGCRCAQYHGQTNFTECREHIEFLQTYENSLKQNQLPGAHEGQQFQPQVEEFQKEFQKFSINLSIMKRYFRIYRKFCCLRIPA